FPPNPWDGDPGLILQGCTPPSSCTLDGGALLVTNGTSSTVTVNSVIVQLDTCSYDIWPHNVSLPAGQHLINIQTRSGAVNGCTSDGTFDTSDVGPGGQGWAGHCNESGVLPIVSVTINGATSSFVDTNQVLNTGGVDLADCPGGNESQPWTQLNDAVPASFWNGGGSRSAPNTKTCQQGRPVVCTTGDFW